MACLAAPLVLWVPESLPACARLCRAVPACGALSGPIGCPYNKSLETSMPGGLMLRCPDATLAGLAGWLAWLAGLAGWLQLAGCCWLAAAGWLMEGSLTRSTLWGGRRISMVDLGLISGFFQFFISFH
jgi:hypothetical protein